MKFRTRPGFHHCVVAGLLLGGCTSRTTTPIVQQKPNTSVEPTASDAVEPYIPPQPLDKQPDSDNPIVADETQPPSKVVGDAPADQETFPTSPPSPTSPSPTSPSPSPSPTHPTKTSPEPSPAAANAGDHTTTPPTTPTDSETKTNHTTINQPTVDHTTTNKPTNDTSLAPKVHIKLTPVAASKIGGYNLALSFPDITSSDIKHPKLTRVAGFKDQPTTQAISNGVVVTTPAETLKIDFDYKSKKCTAEVDVTSGATDVDVASKCTGE